MNRIVRWAVAVVLFATAVAYAGWKLQRSYISSDNTVTTKSRYVVVDTTRTIEGQVTKYDTLGFGDYVRNPFSFDALTIGIEYDTDAGMDTTLDCWVERIEHGQRVNIHHPVTGDSLFIKISGEAGSRQSGLRVFSVPWLGDSLVVITTNRNVAADSATAVRIWAEFWQALTR